MCGLRLVRVREGEVGVVIESCLMLGRRMGLGGVYLRVA
jgi:hypothetical protein